VRIRRAERIIFSSFIKIRERQREIKEHSNNKVIINRYINRYNIGQRTNQIFGPCHTQI